MDRIDSLAPGQAAGLGALLVAANPKNLILTIGGAAGLGQLGLSTGDFVVALIVFVVVASVTITGPVVDYRRGGARCGRTRSAHDVAGRKQRDGDGSAAAGVRRGPHRQGARDLVVSRSPAPRAGTA
jgi:hypothetical protein